MKDWGIFKEVYNGQGIYWAGTYNFEGTGSFKTLSEVKKAIDKLNELRAERERVEKETKIANGAIRAVRSGDSVTIYFPTGAKTFSIREYRQQIFDLEDQHGEIILF